VTEETHSKDAQIRDVDLSAIDRGEAPARTVRQLVSAIRQDLAAGGADRYTLRLALQQGDTEAAIGAAERLAAAFDRIEKKATLAMEADRV
jgi:hypothetical protein